MSDDRRFARWQLSLSRNHGRDPGPFELTFVATMFCFRPSTGSVISGTFTFHADPEYVKLVTASIGSVIMPWMIDFQQSAVVARRMTPGEMRTEMPHILFGSFLTQLVMIGALVTMAAAHPSAKSLESVHGIVAALAPAAGETPAKKYHVFGFHCWIAVHSFRGLVGCSMSLEAASVWKLRAAARCGLRVLRALGS